MSFKSQSYFFPGNSLFSNLNLSLLLNLSKDQNLYGSEKRVMFNKLEFNFSLCLKSFHVTRLETQVIWFSIPTKTVSNFIRNEVVT